MIASSGCWERRYRKGTSVFKLPQGGRCRADDNGSRAAGRPVAAPRQWRIDETHAPDPRSAPRHRPHSRPSLRRRLPQPGPERRAAQLPHLLLHVRGGRRRARPRRPPPEGGSLCERLRGAMAPAQPAQRLPPEREDGPGRAAALVFLGERPERRASGLLGARGGLPVLRRTRRRGRHRLHGRRPPGHRRAHRALAGRLADRRPAPRTGGRRHQGRPVRTRAAPDPAGGGAGAVPHPAPRHPGHGPARGPPPGRDRLRPGGGHGGVPGRRLRPHPARELVAGRHRGGRGGRPDHPPRPRRPARPRCGAPAARGDLLRQRCGPPDGPPRHQT